MATEELRHPNYDELMGFVREVFVEMTRPGSELKKLMALKTVGSPAPNAFQQAMIEVRQQDGGFGLSGMTAKDWFNDTGVRAPWGDQIAAIHEAYKAATAEAVEEAKNKDAVAEELKAIRAQLAALQEAAAKKDDSKNADGAPDEAETPAEDAAETAADEEAEGDTEAAKAKAKKD